MRKQVALHVRAWIEIPTVDQQILTPMCRPLREGVDRNETHNNGADTVKVALYARAWIEIPIIGNVQIIELVALYARAWIEIKRTNGRWKYGTRRPLREGVDRNTIDREDNG